MAKKIETTTIPFEGKSLEVLLSDLPGTMNLKQAIEACGKLGEGWRLPTTDELEVLYKNLHLKGKGKFSKDEYYWSSSHTPDGFKVTYSFPDDRTYIDTEDGLNKVRAIRNV